jgi:hypothetical protein
MNAMAMQAPAMLIESKSAAPKAPTHELLSVSSRYRDLSDWQFVAYSRLHDLERSTGQAEVDAGMDAKRSTGFARAIIDLVKAPDLPIPTVCPVPGSSVGMIWSVGQKQLEAIFEPNATGTYIVVCGGEVSDDGEFSSGSIGSLETALQSILVG